MSHEKRKKTLAAFETFNAVYTSGFFIPDSSLVTAMCLLFDKTWLPNNIELVIELVKKYRVGYQSNDTRFNKENFEFEGLEDPFVSLTSKQQESAINYLRGAVDFCSRYQPLIKEEILCTDLFSTGDVYNILNKKILEVTKLEEDSNKYRVKAEFIMKSEMQLVGGEDRPKTLDKLISRGAIPLLSTEMHASDKNKSSLSVKYLSSLLAMKSVELTLPQTKPAHPEVILEAREKLGDLLPPYWNAMLKLTKDFKVGLEQDQSLHDIERECEDYIDLNVRPILIELKSKLEKDRRSWFHKILSSVVTQMKVLVGKPPMTTAGLVSSGLQLGANVALDIIPADFSSQEPGLTFLIELDKFLRKEGEKVDISSN